MVCNKFTTAIVAFSLTYSVAVTAQQPSRKLIKDAVELTGTDELTESSGLAFSTRDPNCIWTHNDSGHAPKLFAFDIRTGKLTGECRLAGATAMDWESLTSAGKDSRELIVADSGDNDARREFITLYRFDEPDPHRITELAASDYQSLSMRFPGGPVDCEAVWYDASESSLMLLTKGRLPFAGAFRVPDELWQQSVAPDDARERSPAADAPPPIVTAIKIATLALPMATGADLDPVTGDIWVASYFQAFCFQRGTHANLHDQLTDVPIAVEMPRWRQIEGIAVDKKSQVWITTEGIPAKLGRLP